MIISQCLVTIINLLSLRPLTFHERFLTLMSSYMVISAADMCICNKKNAWPEIKHVSAADRL